MTIMIIENKIKKLICALFGHNLKPLVSNGRKRSIKYFKCKRCGKKISVTEAKQRGWGKKYFKYYE